MTIKQRFNEKVLSFEVDGHKIWVGSRSQHGRGYGQMYIDGKLIQATHIAWFLETGKWPTNLMLHKSECQRKDCIKFDHLYEGNKSQNALDAVNDGVHTNSNKTHCFRGHELTKDNLFLWPLRSGKQRRQCKQCHRLAVNRYNTRRKGGA